MKRANDIFIAGKQILENAGCESAGFDAACIFEYVYNISRTQLILDPDKMLDEGDFLPLCHKRAGGYPLQYILGSWEFMGLSFDVNESVLIPRADTETLTEYIINLGGSPKILDMCTGSGCIGIAIKHFLKDADVTLADISEAALTVARKNADKNNADVKIIKADLMEGAQKYFVKESFDIIVSNPPYIKSGDKETLSGEVLCEPHIALFSGNDGTDHYKALINLWKDALKRNGLMVLESGYDTWQDIVALFEQYGYEDIKTVKDIGGITRLVCARKV